jgi:hypothetical protein
MPIVVGLTLGAPGQLAVLNFAFFLLVDDGVDVELIHIRRDGEPRYSPHHLETDGLEVNSSRLNENLMAVSHRRMDGLCAALNARAVVCMRTLPLHNSRRLLHIALLLCTSMHVFVY